MYANKINTYAEKYSKYPNGIQIHITCMLAPATSPACSEDFLLQQNKLLMFDWLSVANFFTQCNVRIAW